MITLVGLGVEKGDLTERGKQAILSAEKVIVRTGLAKSVENVAELGVEFTTLDEYYGRSRNFTTLHKKLAKAVMDAGKTANVVYCVDGNVTEDRSAEIIMRRQKKAVVIGGVSKAQRALERAKIPAEACAGISAYDLLEINDLTMPAVIYDLDNEFLAGDVKMYLTDKVGEETTVYFVRGDKCKRIPLYELDRQKKYDYTTAVVIPRIPLLEKKRFDVKDLVDIIVRLRQPDGCPWDKVQTPETIRMNVIEEAYELVDAIDLGDPDKIREETGDVMLQAVFHAVMQEELGNFNLTDALTELCDKLIFRHSHIFGKDTATDEASALSVWEKNKMKEKGQDTFAKSVNDVPVGFPACMRAQKVQKRAGKSGFDFKDAEEAATKIYEELKEWEEAYREGDAQHKQEELGDLLFAVINVGRLAGVDCELALKESVNKFSRRFTALENAIIADGKDITKLTPEELDEYYRKAKAKL